MKKIIDRFSAIFAEEKFLAGSVAATLLFYAVNLVAKVLCGLYSLFIVDLIFFFCVVALFVAYRKHNKNVQKGLLGAVLMWYLYDEVNYVVANIIFNGEVFDVYDNFWGRGYIYMSVATMVLFAALFVNHFIINGDHHSRSANVFLNQLLVIVIAVLSIVSMCFQCFLFDGEFASSLEALSWHTGLAALVLMIAAYESRFNAYKLKRESAEE
ncbi:MAG: hypothetical protein KBS45_00925 [Clostridiales bacterium]|nr:hypothetical protein [Candidatus Coliplasma caballi]